MFWRIIKYCFSKNNYFTTLLVSWSNYLVTVIIRCFDELLSISFFLELDVRVLRPN